MTMDDRSTYLSAERVTVRLGGRTLLEAVDLQCAIGEITVLLGPNGAGKSTLLRACAGLVACEGRVTIAGRSVAEMRPRERAKQLAIVPQQSELTSALPVHEVVAQGRYACRHPLARRGADDRRVVDASMHRTDTLKFAQRPFTQLSFGEQRRVLVARGLAGGAKVLLLDEPTAALDIGHALALYGLLRTLADDGYAIVVVLHQLSDALAVGDRAVLLHEGRAVRSGSVRDVIVKETVKSVYGVILKTNAAPGFVLPESSVRRATVDALEGEP